MTERQPTPGVHQNIAAITDESGHGSGMGFGPAATSDDSDLCPICQVAFQPNDICASDIELGTCHAACLKGSLVVDLETGDELPGGQMDTYPYGDLFPSTPAPETRMRGPHAGPPVRAVHGLSETSGATALDARPEIRNSRLMSGAVAVLYPSPQSNVVAEQSGIAVLDCTRLSRTEREQEQNPSIEMTLLQSGGLNAEKTESEDQHSNTKDQRNRGFHEETLLTVSSVKFQDHPNVPATAPVTRVEA